MTEDQVYLKYILECIDKIQTYSLKGKDEFIANIMIQDAILRRLQTLTESTQRLSENIKTKITEIDWREIAGFRNILVPNYLGGIDLDIIWDVIESYLPDFKIQIKQALEDLETLSNNL